MYYKIENKNSEVYKQLLELRLKEKEIKKYNELKIKEKCGSDFKNFLGDSGQQNFRRVPTYMGFEFTEPDKIDQKIWKKHDTHSEIYVPNRRTKAGREMEEFIFNGLGSSSLDELFDILNIKQTRKFVFPFLEIAGDLLLLFLGDNVEISDPDLIEITKIEFNLLIKNK